MEKRRQSYRYRFSTWEGLSGNFPARLPSFKFENLLVNENQARNFIFYCPYTFSNTNVSGDVVVEINNCRQSTLGFPNDSDDTNLKLPRIIDGDMRFLVIGNNSAMNIAFNGTSNVVVELEIGRASCRESVWIW